MRRGRRERRGRGEEERAIEDELAQVLQLSRREHEERVQLETGEDVCVCIHVHVKCEFGQMALRKPWIRALYRNFMIVQTKL